MFKYGDVCLQRMDYVGWRNVLNFCKQTPQNVIHETNHLVGSWWNDEDNAQTTYFYSKCGCHFVCNSFEEILQGILTNLRKCFERSNVAHDLICYGIPTKHAKVIHVAHDLTSSEVQINRFGVSFRNAIAYPKIIVVVVSWLKPKVGSIIGSPNYLFLLIIQWSP